MLAELKKHTNIALDFDETLIGSKYSKYLWNFIEDNPDKNYWIVTFRSGSLADPGLLWLSLLEESGNRILDTHFKGYVFCPDGLSSDFEKLIHWKGEVCKKIGCTVIVDDRPDWVYPGCEVNDIVFIDTVTLRI